MKARHLLPTNVARATKVGASVETCGEQTTAERRGSNDRDAELAASLQQIRACFGLNGPHEGGVLDLDAVDFDDLASASESARVGPTQANMLDFAFPDCGQPFQS
jgi:hypothetical protein